MATLVNTGTQAQVTAASSITVNSPSATAGNKLICQLAWLDAVASGPLAAPSAPAGWTRDYGPSSSNTTPNTVTNGYAVYSKTAAGGIESPVFNTTGTAGQFYANAIITEWSGLGAHDTQDSTATVQSGSAASTTGVTVPNTGTLTASSGVAFTGVSISAGTGLANAGIAFSGGGWTTTVSDQNTSTSVGSLFGHKTLASNAALGAVYTWTSDSTMFSYMASVVVYGDSSVPSTKLINQGFGRSYRPRPYAPGRGR